MKYSIDVGVDSNLAGLIIKMCAVAFVTLFSVCGYSQTFNVKGEISSSSKPVRYASVTYIDRLDTARHYTAITDTSGDYQLGLLTSVLPGGNVPSKFELDQNYPNPFTKSTSIGYTLNRQAGVSVRIYNVLGQLVKRYRIGEQEAGVHGITWDGTNNLGQRVPPGVYFYQMTAGKQIQARKMLYGFGENGSVSSFIQSIRTPSAESAKIAEPMFVRDYSVEIGNTDSTSPLIRPAQFSVVLSQQDTSIDFSVSGSPYEPTRLPGSPYPVSQKPDTLFTLQQAGMSYDALLTMESLQGILAQKKPEIYIANGAYNVWLSDLITKYGVYNYTSYQYDYLDLIKRFKSRIKGYILTTTTEPSIDVAFSMAGIKDAIVVTSADEQAIANLGIPKIADVTNETYEQFLSEYQGEMNKHALCFQTAANNKAQYLPDWAIFGKMFFYYGDITGSTASQIFSDMDSNSALFGWYSSEGGLVQAASDKSIMVHAADLAMNISTLANFGVKTVQASHDTTVQTIDSVQTVCFLMSDGDNVQWLLSGFGTDQRWYASPSRGQMNLGWTISPALCELAPTVMSRFYDNESTKPGGRDYFVAGPSGLGYMYPEDFKSLTSYTALTGKFMKKADLNIVNVIGATNAPAIPTNYLIPYLNQTQIDAVFYYPANNWAGANGQIEWVKGKPIIAARYNLNVNDPSHGQTTEDLAALLNSSSTDIHSAAGYSLIDVNVWYEHPDSVAKCVSLLNKNVRVVAPDEFVALIKNNVKH